MKYYDRGLIGLAIGMPSEEERKRLKEDGFTLMISHVSSKPNEPREDEDGK